MSVLFKALQRAQQARSGDGAGPSATAQPAAAGAQHAPVGAATPGRGRKVVRVAGLGVVVLLAGAVAAMMLFRDRIEDVLLTAAVQEPSPPPAAPASRSAPQPAPQPAAEETPVDAAPEMPAAETTNIAALMDIARAAKGQADAAGVPAPVQATGPKGGPVRLIPQERPALGGPEDLTPPAPARERLSVPARERLSVPARERLSVEDALAAERRRQEVAALAAPVTVQRPAAARAGAGAGVTVSVPSVQARDSMAAAYRALLRGQYTTALGGYDAALAEDPRNLQALLGRAAALHKLGRLEPARAAYEKVLARDPGNREALTNLLAIIAAGAPREALARLLDLERTAPDFTPVLAQIGMLYGTLGEPGKGAAYLERAVQRDSSLLYLYNMAVLLDQAGRRRAAADAYKAVLDGVSRDPDALRVSAASLRARLNYLLAKR